MLIFVNKTLNYTHSLTSDLIKDDISKVIRKKFQTGKRDAQEIAKALGLTKR